MQSQGKPDNAVGRILGKPAAERTVDHDERRCALVAVGRIEVRRVGDIEELGAELQFEPLGQREFPEHARVEVYHAGSTELVEVHIAEVGKRAGAARYGG